MGDRVVIGRVVGRLIDLVILGGFAVVGKFAEWLCPSEVIAKCSRYVECDGQCCDRELRGGGGVPL